MNKQQQFKTREEHIFQVAEALLLDSGETGMTLDALALQLDLAKGTLYKHFQSKDELYLHLIIRNEQMLLDMTEIQEDFPARLTLFVTHHLYNAQRTILLHQLEEKLAATSNQLNGLFSTLYRIRKLRLRRIIGLTTDYLTHVGSSMPVRDYLASIWSMTQGSAMILNSTFYQRYLGDRSTLRVNFIEEMLYMPLAPRYLSAVSHDTSSQ